jgi:hypothetical protein
MRAQCEDIRETKWSKRADTLNSFSFETPTGKRYSAHDVNLYKSVILMIAMACFVVVVVLSLSLSLFRNSKGSPRLRLRLRKTRRLFKVSFFRA